MNSSTGSQPVILTIDDEEAVRTSIRHYLEDYDFNVIEARDGREGIEQLERTPPDLVLVDLRMPEVDGLDVLAFVKEHISDTPIIVVSGTGVIGDVIEALRLGAWDFLIKPIQDMAVLKHAVDKALERARLLRERRDYQIRLEEEVRARTTEVIEQRDLVHRKAEEEALIGSVSRLSLQPLSMQEYLQGALELLLESVSWLQLLPKGGVFLDTGPETRKQIELITDVGLDQTVRQQCQYVDFGECLCGQAAATGRLQFTSHVDDRHSRQYPDMVDHGHYTILICHNDRVLGVLQLYLRSGINSKPMKVSSYSACPTYSVSAY